MKNSARSIALLSCALLLSVVTLTGCSKEEAPKSTEQKVDSMMKQQTAASNEAATTAASSVALNDKAKKGQAIFYNASFGKIKSSCAMCHSDGTEKTTDTKLRSGHTLVGVTSRTSTWNGMYKGDKLASSAYGAALCAAGFQERAEGKVSAALSADEVESLNEYFAAIANNPEPMKSNLSIKWVTKPIFNDDESLDEKAVAPAVKGIMKLAGDPGKGQAVFTTACASCHDIKTKKVGPSMKDAAQDMNYVAQSIRCGSLAMPFFAKDKLSDQQISDVVAYIQSSLDK